MKRRISASEGIQHPFVESFHDKDDEPLFEGTLDFAFEEDQNLTLDELKKLILKEIAAFDESYFDLL